MIYDIIISPIETVFAWIFNAVYNRIPRVGIVGAIFSVSLAMNFLSAPLFAIADKIQEQERKTAKNLEHWVRHINHTFKGDERFMMLSEYYRQNHYHPIFALRSTLSILIQIPFFIAAYHYLRTNSLLNGAQFFFIKNLAKPDSLVLLTFLGCTINILPIIMTAINCASGILYSKELPFREKLQIYLLTVIFLVLLYNSPSGLVIYWTFNNIFSLLRNFIKKSEKKGRVLRIFTGVLLLIATHFAAVKKTAGYGFLFIVIGAFAWLLIFLPQILKILEKTKGRLVSNFEQNLARIASRSKLMARKFRTSICMTFERISAPFAPDFPFLLLSGLSLFLLCGIVLPSSVIASSPLEFSFLGNTSSPLSYIAHTAFVFFGFFVFYPTVFYFLFGKKVRSLLPILLFAIFLCSVCNAYILKFTADSLDVAFSIPQSALRPPKAIFLFLPLEIAFAAVVLAWISQKVKKSQRKSYMNVLIFACCLGMAALGSVNIYRIKGAYLEFSANKREFQPKEHNSSIEKSYHLSKTGKNVIVLFLDRGIGPFVEEIFESYPEIKKQFDGFVNYQNIVSFSTSTVTGAPPLYGGYEYTQEAMNARSSELLRNKNTEAQLVLPKIFLDGGFTATMTDPIWPNYRWAGDLTPYSRLPRFTVTELEGRNYENFINEKSVSKQLDNTPQDALCREQIINFSLLQTLYPEFRHIFYNNMRLPKAKIPPAGTGWLLKFSHLYYLPQQTDFECPSEKGAFISMHFMAAHDVYTPADDFETPAEIPLTDNSEVHYRVNIACLRQFGKYFDFLRENNCYDNTRIIIVSDHGRTGVKMKPYANFTAASSIAGYSAMLLVKDFNSNAPEKIDATFMTNADAPLLALEGLGLSDTNPYTGKKLAAQKENGVNVYACTDWNAGNFFDAKQFALNEEKAWHVSGNIYDEDNWIPLTEWKKQNGGKN